MPDPVAPEISGLVQPGAGATAGGPMPDPSQPAPPPEALTPGMAAPDVTDRSINPAVAPSAPAGVVSPNAPHARLTKMVLGLAQGLSDSLAGFSAGVASKGKVSGAAVVQELESQRQQMKQSASAEMRAQQDADLRNKMTTAQTNQVLTQTHMLNATMQDEMGLKHTQAQEAGMNLQKQAQAIFNEQGQVPTGWQVDPNTWQLTQVQPGAAQANASAVGTNPPTTAPAGATPSGTPAPAQQRASILLDAYGKELQDEKGNDDPLVAKARQIIADPNASPAQKQQALIAVQQKSGLTKQVIQNLTEKADLAVKQQTGAQGAIKTDQEQLAQSTYNRTVPKNAQGLPTEDFATWQARSTKEAEVKAQQGDPSALGEMAADGLITIPQIAIARQLDKKGFQTLLAAADARAKANGAPEVMVNGKGTGHYFNANAATQQYDYVKEFNNPNSKNQQSINSGSTFMEHMNDLLAVNQKYGRTNTKILNTPLNKIADLFGNTTYTELMAAIAPVKTEYDNALKAGFAPTSEDAATVEQLLKPNSTPAQIETAGKTMAHTILRRLDSTNQGYKTHTGTDYPNMLTPDAASALQNMGIDTQGLQSGGSFAGTPQAGVTAGRTQTPAPTTHVFNSAAWAAANPGKDVNAAIAQAKAQGFQVK